VLLSAPERGSWKKKNLTFLAGHKSAISLSDSGFTTQGAAATQFVCTDRGRERTPIKSKEIGSFFSPIKKEQDEVIFIEIFFTRITLK